MALPPLSKDNCKDNTSIESLNGVICCVITKVYEVRDYSAKVDIATSPGRLPIIDVTITYESWLVTSEVDVPSHNTDYPHQCPGCGKPAYISIFPGSKPDCLAKCERSQRWPLL